MREIHESDDYKSNLDPKMTPATICLPSFFSFFEVFVIFYITNNSYILIISFLYQSFFLAQILNKFFRYFTAVDVFNGTVSVPMLTEILFHLYTWHHTKSVSA